MPVVQGHSTAEIKIVSDVPASLVTQDGRLIDTSEPLFTLKTNSINE